MTNRGNVGCVFSTLVLAAALWASSAGVSSAQTCGGEGQPPCPVVCGPPVECVPCIDCLASACPPSGFYPVTCPATTYGPGQTANVFTFGDNNSINIKFPSNNTCTFVVTVTLNPATQEEFHTRVAQVSNGGVCPALSPPRLL